MYYAVVESALIITEPGIFIQIYIFTNTSKEIELK